MEVRGRHVPTPSQNYIFFKFSDSPSDLRVEAAFHHELLHDFTQRGLFDLDIPTAAALEYFWEWTATSTLEDSERIRHFQDGLGSTDISFDVTELMRRYITSDLSETPISENAQSYNDGARLAGLVFGQFQGNRDLGFRYLLLLSSSCAHDLARHAVENPALADLILRFRTASLDYFDIALNDEFRRAVNGLDDASRVRAEQYVYRLMDTHALDFRKRRPSIVGAMPSMFPD